MRVIEIKERERTERGRSDETEKGRREASTELETRNYEKDK